MIAAGSLAGFIFAVVAYSYYPLPGSWSQSSWESAGLWASLALLALGLICFIAFLISGLISVLNWGVDGPADRSPDD
jgi:hypothetical protein